MIDPDDDDTVAGSRGDATVVSRRRSAPEPSRSDGDEASETTDETLIRPRASVRASAPDELAAPPSPPRRTASSGQPENTVYRPRPVDPVIVPRTQR